MTLSKNTIFDPCNTYVLLWVLGHVQNMFLNSSFISMVFYLPYLVMTLYYIAKVVLNYHFKGVMLAFSVFFIILIVYGVTYLLIEGKNTFILMLLSSLSPIFVFYCFSRQGVLTEKRMIGWLFIFMAVATIEYYTTQNKGLELLAEEGSKYEEITNNAAYSMLGLLPFVFLLKNKPILQYAILGYVMFFVVTGLKRGAILVGLLMVFWFIYINTKTVSKGKRAVIILLTVVVLVVGWHFVMQFYENSDYFQYRVEATMEGSSSNRDWIYSVLWNHYINNDNFLQLVFGEGAFHTVQVTQGFKAHNDWLELLIDCGLLGIVAYLVYWICFIKDWLRSKPIVMVYSMMGACFIFTFMRTFFSMSFSDIPFCVCMIMGYCFAQVQENNNRTLQ